ncbi:Uncharacterised protein [[Flavobacterium] thermophilum]|nr:Uncharacterised protein [[Flavobacterium] thermophilum]
MRRNKLQMKWMREEVTEYLLKTNNDPHAAWDLFIKRHLQAGIEIPEWIHGKKDFVKVSKELEQLGFVKNEMEQKEEQRKQAMNVLKQMSTKEARKLWSKFRNQLTKNEELILVDLINLIYANEWQYIENQHLDLLIKHNMIPLDMAS